MLAALNFADDKFEFNRQYNSKTAIKIGQADIVLEYKPSDIDESFRTKNKNIFAYNRGHGLWLWKPYFILKALDQLDINDYLFYCDSGSFYVNKIKYLTDILDGHGQSIMGFELPLLERQFTKKETFVLMKQKDHSRNQILGSFILLKKNDFTVDFVNEWLEYLCDERIISPNHFCKEIAEFSDFRSHREDQSVFSILYHKYGLTPFRDPSQYGDRPFEYMWIPKYKHEKKPWIYNPHKFENSKYPRILISNRINEPQKFKKKEFTKNILHKIGLFNKYTYYLINSYNTINCFNNI